MNLLKDRKGTSERVQGVLVLAGICLVSGAAVGGLYVYMRPDIRAKDQEAFRKTLAVVLGEAKQYETLGDDAATPPEQRVYVHKTEDGVVYAAMGSAQGYQSEIRVLVSVAADSAGTAVPPDPRVHRLAVVSSQETPGLGEQMRAVKPDVSIWGLLAGREPQSSRPWFQEQFAGKRLSDLQVVKGETDENISALTGATITSVATTKAAREAIKKIIERTSEVYGR